MRHLKKFENKFEENRLHHKNNFINKSVQIHNDKYDYSKVDYITARKPHFLYRGYQTICHNKYF